MLEYERYIRDFLGPFRDLVEAQTEAGFPPWLISLISVLVGALLGFVFGWCKERLKEKRDNKLLKEGMYQEIANNYEAIVYWTAPTRGDFGWLKQNIDREITFLAYEAAAKNPAGLYRMPEHGWLIAVYRELKKLCEQCRGADDGQLADLLKRATETIERGDTDLPTTRMALRRKIQPEYRNNIT
jgi:hypothetical protein